MQLFVYLCPDLKSNETEAPIIESLNRFLLYLHLNQFRLNYPLLRCPILKRIPLKKLKLTHGDSGFLEVQSESQRLPHEDIWIMAGQEGSLELLQLPAVEVCPRSPTLAGHILRALPICNTLTEIDFYYAFNTRLKNFTHYPLWSTDLKFHLLRAPFIISRTDELTARGPPNVRAPNQRLIWMFARVCGNAAMMKNDVWAFGRCQI